MLRGRIALLALGAAVCGGCAAIPTAPGTDRCATIVAAGDLLLDRGVRRQAEREGDPAWALRTLPGVFERADLAVVNLECPLTRRESPAAKKYVFRCDPERAADLKAMGVDVVNLANNHVYDQGRSGILDTLAAAEAGGLVAVGAGPSTAAAFAPKLAKVHGLRIALLGFVAVPLEGIVSAVDGPTPAIVDTRRVAASLEAARRQADVVIVMVHWGVENAPRPSWRQLRWATFFREHGADVVLGAHPHVLQPVEEVRGRWTFYSLGNFVFDQAGISQRRSLVARLEVCRSGVRAVQVEPVEIVHTRPRVGDAETLDAMVRSLLPPPSRLRWWRSGAGVRLAPDDAAGGVGAPGLAGARPLVH